MPSRLVRVTMECPCCQRQWDEAVEVKDNLEARPKTEYGKDSAACPNCGHVEPETSFVGYDDDVWRVPGVNPDFP